MRTRASSAMAGATVVAAAAVVLSLAGGLAGSRSPSTSAAGSDPVAPPPLTPSGRARENCSTRSEASFPDAFTSPRNLVVGPLAIVGGGVLTDAITVRRFGGNKFPLLVEAGHRVTVRVAPHPRTAAGLAYGPLPEGETKLGDTHLSVTFVACRPGSPSPGHNPESPYGSDADGVPVTFWSGAVLSGAPACVQLDVSIDGARPARRVGLPLGRRCGRSARHPR